MFFAIAAGFGCNAKNSYGSFLTSPASDEKLPDSDGFIHRWLILEPIQDDRVATSTIQEAVKYEYFPDQLTSIPHDGDTVQVGGKKLIWHALDSKEFSVNLQYFAQTLGKPTSDVLFWAVTIIDCPQEKSGARLAVGSNSPSMWWANGQDVVEITCDCQNIIDGGVSKRLTLKEGQNIVRCAIFNGDKATDFWARFLDSDGIPFRGYTVNLNKVKELDNSGIVSND